MKPKCVVPNCDATGDHLKNISHFKIPKNESIRKKWQEAIPEVPLLRQSQCVCEKHFEEKYISRNIKQKDNNGLETNITYRSRLLMNAVPTLFGNNVRCLAEFKKGLFNISEKKSLSLKNPNENQQQKIEPILNTVKPVSEIKVENKNYQPIVKSECKIQQFAKLVKNVNKSLSETSENFVTNQILDKLNCHTLQNINKIYPQFSRELEKLKQNDCCEHISIADKLGQPAIIKVGEVEKRRVDQNENNKKAVIIKLIGSQNQVSDLWKEKKEDINDDLSKVKIHKLRQVKSIKTPELKSVIGNKNQNQKLSEKNIQTYTLEEHNGQVVIDLNKKKIAGKRNKPNQNKNCGYIQVLDGSMKKQATENSIVVAEKKIQEKNGKVIINVIRQNKKNIDLNKKITAKENSIKNGGNSLASNSNTPLMKAILNANTNLNTSGSKAKINQTASRNTVKITNEENNSSKKSICKPAQLAQQTIDIQDHNYAAINNEKPKKIDFTSTVHIDDNGSITLPKSWGIIENYTKFGKRLVLTHADTDNEENISNVLLKKSVTIDIWSGRIRYFVYGRQVDHKNIEKLPETFSSNDLLLSLIRSFQNINVCEGIGSTDSKIITQNSSPNDVLVNGNNFYSINCSVVAPIKKCESCKKLRRSILSKKRKLSDEYTNESNDGNEEKKPEVKIRKLNILSKSTNEKNEDGKSQDKVKKFSIDCKSGADKNEKNKPVIKIIESNVISKSNAILMNYRKLLPKKE